MNILVSIILLFLFSFSSAWALPECTTSYFNDCQKSITFKNGNKYEGGWKDNIIHGQGIYTWVNGDKYAGKFKYGKAYGKGTYTSANGNKYIS